MDEVTTRIVKQIEPLLRASPAVDSFYLFGSRAVSQNAYNSDFDFLVRFGPDIDALDGLRQVRRLLEKPLGIYSFDIVAERLVDESFREHTMPTAIQIV